MNILFNQKILAKKAEEEIDLSKHNFSERRKALNKWINNLENGVLEKSKEEESQAEFLNDIFATVLRATNKFNGQNEWNLQRETKTKIDGQKADGVLGFFDTEGKKDVRAVIELKGSKVSLDMRQKRAGDTRTPVEQAFNYAPKYGKNCQWVIVSNYKEIRLYRSNDMTEYQVFFLEKLKDDLEFKKFIYVLSFSSLVGTEKKKAKTLELSEEYQKKQAEIEKKFYNEYKNIRLHIFENMRKNNPTINENIIIEKVQKLLDRFLFICFCEDKGLLPNEIFYKTLEKGKKIKNIFEIFLSLCRWIDIGNSRENIPRFNGGLFKNDDILDGLYVDNEVFEEMQKISEYDFDSELNENILGHIFEQSITDIEDLKKEINGEKADKKKGKRKKDGIFYTPKYITKYIVENSIKNWLDDKRKELGEDKLPELKEKDYDYDVYKKNYTKNYRKHIEFWTKYKEAVKNIKIVDPACGSGAFLITAFECLLKKNNYIDNKIFDLTGVKDLFSDTTKEILQNNIFGVDLNKESVEITKLSLWLKTADKNKTLASLENNIKCGNSLIDDVEIAGELAFDWEKEFPQVFKNGGFDVVVGNPPYVFARDNFNEIEKNYYIKNYVSSNYQINTYILFMEKSFKLLKNKGYASMIVPNSWLMMYSGKGIREYILENIKLLEIVNLAGHSFENVNVETVIYFGYKEKGEFITRVLLNKGKEFIYSHSKNSISFINEEEKLFKVFSDEYSEEINKKIFKNSTALDEIVEIKAGLQAYEKGKGIPKQTEEDVKNRPYDYTYKFDEETYKYLEGNNVGRYSINWSGQYLKYGENLAAPRSMELFNGKKIIIREITGAFPKNIISTYTEEFYLYNRSNIGIIEKEGKKIDLKYILVVLNSTLISYYFMKNTAKSVRKLFPKIILNDLRTFPFKEISLQEQQPFIEKADKMLALNKELQEISQKFQRMIMREFGLEKISAKLQNWYLLNFDEFIKELSKAKVKLSLSQKADWEDYFIAEKLKAETLNNEITKTDKEIDGMVYELYELSEEEVRVVES
ncbi:N-6 DNA methylase [uncultured Leptotrichia sp.]|uniref:Eco57I restriction-modification methylase domain-containing protein n=1 Tax=uncultured Leptotrichia sp. TaxID=159271 RepID=UPI0026238F97|nr:N-6 DNA methylase [uncultured Leptotrichia sp.]